MLLSGTYLDRLFLNVLPYTGGIFITYYFSGELRYWPIIMILTALLWILDSAVICIKFKNPKKLRYRGNLWIGKQIIQTDDICSITPVTDQRFRWSFEMIEILMKDGTKHMIIDKPRTIIASITDRPSGTMKGLIKLYPELKVKMKVRVTI